MNRNFAASWAASALLLAGACNGKTTPVSGQVSEAKIVSNLPFDINDPNAQFQAKLTVTDDRGRPITNATFTAGATTQSVAADGTLTVDSVPVFGGLGGQITAPGYMPREVSLDYNNSGRDPLAVALEPPGVVVDIDAATGGTVQHGGAQFAFPANAFVDDAGNPATGLVSIQMRGATARSYLNVSLTRDLSATIKVRTDLLGSNIDGALDGQQPVLMLPLAQAAYVGTRAAGGSGSHMPAFAVDLPEELTFFEGERLALLRTSGHTLRDVGSERCTVERKGDGFRCVYIGSYSGLLAAIPTKTVRGGPDLCGRLAVKVVGTADAFEASLKTKVSFVGTNYVPSFMSADNSLLFTSSDFAAVEVTLKRVKDRATAVYTFDKNSTTAQHKGGVRLMPFDYAIPPIFDVISGKDSACPTITLNVPFSALGMSNQGSSSGGSTGGTTGGTTTGGGKVDFCTTTAGRDCEAGCDRGNQKCYPPPTCNDETQNNGEADVDCGGPCTLKCALGSSCREASDCATNTCRTGLCVAAPVIPSNPCDTNNGGCGENATCANNSGTAACTCAADYAGTPCTKIDNCIGNACVNGECVDGTNAYTCTCEAGYQGELCDVDIDECGGATTPCGDNGFCENTPAGSYTCDCFQGYAGRNCELVDYCDPDPCNGHGTCTSGASSFSCSCDANYTGSACELRQSLSSFVGMTPYVGPPAPTDSSTGPSTVRGTQFQFSVDVDVTSVLVSGLPSGTAASARLWIVDGLDIDTAPSPVLGTPYAASFTSSTTATFVMPLPVALNRDVYHNFVVSIDAEDGPPGAQNWQLLTLPTSNAGVEIDGVNLGLVFGWYGSLADAACTSGCSSDSSTYDNQYFKIPNLSIEFQHAIP